MAELRDLVKRKFGASVLDTHADFGDQTVVIAREGVIEVMRWLKEDPAMGFDFMMDLTAVDYLGKKPRDLRFEVVYHLYSLKHNHRIRVKAPVGEDDASLDSIVSLWKAADWFEREVWDLYGIVFKGHPNLKRILLYEEFVGHPLRKDYNIRQRQPLIGPEN
ncbi:MAG: NADH-quinone oxidoreductase subunit C [Nitrospinae bacterium]|nr:NADH-quinone oxidoreductase subunit C [Nitrospinota bacterium]